MSKTVTKYIIVANADMHKSYSTALNVAKLLDDGYTLVISWVVGEAVHHILSKDQA